MRLEDCNVTLGKAEGKPVFLCGCLKNFYQTIITLLAYCGKGGQLLAKVKKVFDKIMKLMKRKSLWIQMMREAITKSIRMCRNMSQKTRFLFLGF